MRFKYKKNIIVLFLFVVQYLIVVVYTLLGLPNIFNFQVALFIVTAILAGWLSGFTMDKIGESFAKGVASMAFVGFVIGLARTASLIMGEGNIIHTIVYIMTRPLQLIGKEFTAILFETIVAVINPFIPSSSAKAAILVPVFGPVAESIGLTKQVTAMALQYADGITDLFTPLLGWTIGSLQLTGVPFTKWFKWVMPIVIVFIFLSFVFIYVLAKIGYTGI